MSVQIKPGVQPNHIHVIWKDLPIYYVNVVRRVLMADIPTMAIEYVYIQENTSLIPDEFLVHRLGLVPIQANAYLFRFPSTLEPPDANSLQPDTHLLFSLRVTEGNIVHASQLKWIPLHQSQQRMNPLPSIVHPDIPLLHLPPGGNLDIRCVATKGTGRDHVKWSAVEHVYYYYDDDDDDDGEEKEKEEEEERLIIMEIESKGIYSGPELLIKALTIIRDQLNNLEQELNIPSK